MTKPKFAVIEGQTADRLFPRNICFGADGTYVIGEIPGQKHLEQKNRLAKWDAATGRILDVVEVADVDQCWDLAPSPSHGFFAQKTDTKVVIRNAESLAEARSMNLAKRAIMGIVVWSSTGNLVAANSTRLEVWDATNGKLLAQYNTYERPIGFLSESPLALLFGENECVSLWTSAQGIVEKVLKMPKGKGFTWDHVLSPDRKALISVSETGTILKTDSSMWKSTVASGMRSSCGFAFGFSPDSRQLAITGSTGTLLIWDVVGNRPWLKWNKPNYHTAASPTFSPDGLRLAIVLDRRLHVLDFRAAATPQALSSSRLAAGLIQCIEMVGPDERMDLEGSNLSPLNPLPIKCPTCRMPDLDHVADVYLLGRGIDKPVDFAQAENGNFLVRESGRRVLEAVAPRQCRFIPTINRKNKQTTHWFLAIPLNQQVTATPPTDRDRCPDCSEP